MPGHSAQLLQPRMCAPAQVIKEALPAEAAAKLAAVQSSEAAPGPEATAGTEATAAPSDKPEAMAEAMEEGASAVEGVATEGEKGTPAETAGDGTAASEVLDIDDLDFGEVSAEDRRAAVALAKKCEADGNLKALHQADEEDKRRAAWVLYAMKSYAPLVSDDEEERTKDLEVYAAPGSRFLRFA